MAKNFQLTKVKLFQPRLSPVAALRHLMVETMLNAAKGLDHRFGHSIACAP
jgi:hypothetical protein